MLISTYCVKRIARTAQAGEREEKPPISYAERTECKNVKGADHADDGTKDHALPVVRYPGRSGGEILRLRLQEFQDRKNQPLRKRGIRDSREEGGNGHDRGARDRRAKIRGPQWRPAFQVQRGRVVPGSLRHTARDRLLLEQACQGR